MEKEGWDSATRDALHKIATALGFLWLSHYYLRLGCIPASISRFYIYCHNMNWGCELLQSSDVGQEKRIKITIEIEDAQ